LNLTTGVWYALTFPTVVSTFRGEVPVALTRRRVARYVASSPAVTLNAQTFADAGLRTGWEPGLVPGPPKLPAAPTTFPVCVHDDETPRTPPWHSPFADAILFFIAVYDCFSARSAKRLSDWNPDAIALSSMSGKYNERRHRRVARRDLGQLHVVRCLLRLADRNHVLRRAVIGGGFLGRDDGLLPRFVEVDRQRLPRRGGGPSGTPLRGHGRLACAVEGVPQRLLDAIEIRRARLWPLERRRERSRVLQRRVRVDVELVEDLQPATDAR
jgi:hypothetical protein